MTIEQIARVCHEANRAYCLTQGDPSQKPWEEAAEWQRASAIKGVEFALFNPQADASAQHNSWLTDKLKDGWKFGPVKNEAKKEHPCIVPFEQLPEAQKRKDQLFLAVVQALR